MLQKMDGDICIIDDLPHIMVCGLLRMTWSPPWDMGLVLEVWITFDAYFNKETCHWAVDFSVFSQFSDKLHTLADLPLIEDVSWILMIYKFDTHHMSLVDFYGYLYTMGIAIIVWHCFTFTPIIVCHWYITLIYNLAWCKSNITELIQSLV